MAAPQITQLPPPPLRNDAPADFVQKADAFVAALPQFVTDANTQASFTDQRAADADASAAAAAASEANAAGSARLSESHADRAAGFASIAADRALPLVAEAQAYAQASASASEAAVKSMAQANALLGLGLGGAVVDHAGHLVIAYEDVSVAGVRIVEGHVLVDYSF